MRRMTMANEYEKELLEVAKRYTLNFVGHDITQYNPDSFNDNDITDVRSFEFFQKLRTKISGDGFKITTTPTISLIDWETITFRYTITYVEGDIKGSNAIAAVITTFECGVYINGPYLIDYGIDYKKNPEFLKRFQHQLLAILLTV